MGKAKRTNKRQRYSDLSDDLLLVHQTLGRTFECKRFHCRLLPERCVQRQTSWDPEIYEGCIGCNQGLEMAKKINCSEGWLKQVKQGIQAQVDNQWCEPVPFLTLLFADTK